MSNGSALVAALPDLLLMLRRDGVILEHAGGAGLEHLRPPAAAIGSPIDALWPSALTTPIRQLIRKALSTRLLVEARFRVDGRRYHARVSAQAPDRVLCVMRLIASREAKGLQHAPSSSLFDRRVFLERFKDSIAMAALREADAAVAMIQMDGLIDVARIVDIGVAEQLLDAALHRLRNLSASDRGAFRWYVGPLRDQWLGVLLDTSDRSAIENCLTSVCDSLRQPICIGDAMFELTPHAGVAILGRDASTPGGLLNRARAAAAEACRTASPRIQFFSDTLKLRSLARIDLARELRDAIANREIRLRYVGRHDLSTGELVAQVAYVQWLHPLRGEIRPADFLAVAETTGLAVMLSKAALECLGADLAAHGRLAPGVRVSYGALRHHILHSEFDGDIARFLASGIVPAEQLELRVSEKTFVTGNPHVYAAVRRLGVRMIVDEVGRGIGSIDALARSSIDGLQLDRSWVTGLCTDEVALKVCRAGIGLANSLALTPIATGVDDEQQRRGLVSLGCRYGSGDLYRDCSPAAFGIARVRSG